MPGITGGPSRTGTGEAPLSSLSAPAGSVTLQERVSSHPEAVREALERLSRRLRILGLSQEDATNAEIVLAEAMNNVVEHAYREADGGWLGLRAELHPDRLVCRIEDSGHPMPDMELPAGARQDLDVALDDLPEGGFGWFMIRELTTNLVYMRHGDVNRLTFAVPRDRTTRI